MSKYGTCETGCTETKLELVRAAAHDALGEFSSGARKRADAFRVIAEELAGREPSVHEWQAAYRSLQERARATLRQHPDAGRGEMDWGEPSEPATTWWCEKCGGIDAPQPCLGICVWRPVEWVSRTLYEHAREQALADRDSERHLRELLRRVAFVTPHPDQWQRNWQALRAEAVRALDQSGDQGTASKCRSTSEPSGWINRTRTRR